MGTDHAEVAVGMEVTDPVNWCRGCVENPQLVSSKRQQGETARATKNIPLRPSNGDPAPNTVGNLGLDAHLALSKRACRSPM